tara:strand:- start:1068 stop:1268 length:201 start_codon:yes stop_codon:yes gene_type:complete
MTTLTIKCQRCGEVLDSKKAKWLELSQTDGNYYTTLPSTHISQGGFSFGTACAVKQIHETITSIKQ